MSRHFIHVGTGDYWRRLSSSCLGVLGSHQVFNAFTLVGLESDGGPTTIRSPEQPLSEVVDKIDAENPTVLLAHPNHLHAPEALELLENSPSTKIIIEKPYAIDKRELEDLTQAMTNNRNRIALAESFLASYAAPLMVAAGLVAEDSFYRTDQDSLQPIAHMSMVEGCLEERVGKPLYALVNLVQGKGSDGSVEHRNLSLVDSRLGGGMIQDMGHHALAPLLALDGGIGDLEVIDVARAWCQEYVTNACQKISGEHVGESYAQIDLISTKGVPVRACVGKYVGERNQLAMTIVGTKGTVLCDYSGRRIAFSTIGYEHNDEPFPSSAEWLMECRTGQDAYYPVLRTAMEGADGKHPFKFDASVVALRAQRLLLRALEKKDDGERTKYQKGTPHDQIFS